MLYLDQKTYTSVSYENLPIIFLGSNDERVSIESKFQKTNENVILIDEVRNNVGRKLSCRPYGGLLTGYDQDVLTAVYCFLSFEYNQHGSCPEDITIYKNDFGKLMGRTITGTFYDRIITSIKRIADFDIYQENMIMFKKDGALIKYDEEKLNLIHYNRQTKIYPENDKTKMRKGVVNIGIPVWVRNHYDFQFISEFDYNLFFALGSNYRAKRLYKILELIRYNFKKRIPYKKIENELWLHEYENKIKNRAIKRSFEPLIDLEYIKSYDFIDGYFVVNFNDIKTQNETGEGGQKSFTLDAEQQWFADYLVDQLKDQKSKNFYEKVAYIVNRHVIYKCLSLTEETAQYDGIKKSKGAIFTDHLKRECEAQGIKL